MQPRLREKSWKRNRIFARRCLALPRNNGDTLAVQANKWGGRYVFRWCQVAPLVRVRLARWAVPLMPSAPGLFDKPLLITWRATDIDSRRDDGHSAGLCSWDIFHWPWRRRRLRGRRR